MQHKKEWIASMNIYWRAFDVPSIDVPTQMLQRNDGELSVVKKWIASVNV